jgi:hypothetical protein
MEKDTNVVIMVNVVPNHMKTHIVQNHQLLLIQFALANTLVSSALKNNMNTFMKRVAELFNALKK